MAQFETTNPATGVKLKTYQHTSLQEAEKSLHALQDDFLKWRRVDFSERSQSLQLVAEALRSHKDELANLMNSEMGKSIAEGKAEVEKCAITCEYYALEGANMLKNIEVSLSPYPHCEISFQPLGIVFSIMPWNFPLWQVIRFAAPTLMAGNLILLKHADLVAGTAEKIASIFANLKTPVPLLRLAQVTHEDSARLIANPLVKAVTFTGSTEGGRAVAQEAAKNLKKIVLELGGSDPYIILADANLENAAKLCAKARLGNAGQSCVAAKRFIPVAEISERFLALLKSQMEGVELAPLAHSRFQRKISEQVEKLKSLGGKVILGGVVPEGEGAFYPPTILYFEKNHPEIHQEEIFGPVAMVIRAESAEQAMSIANASPFGLGGGVFSENVDAAKQWIEKELESGFVVVNDFVRSDARIPFGGVKNSGYGRELSQFGIHEFVNIKTVASAGGRV